MNKANTQTNKIKRSTKDKLYYIVFGKYPAPKKSEEGEEIEKNISVKKTPVKTHKKILFVNPEFLEKYRLPQEADINDDERIFGALSYFPLLSFFVLIARKDSAFAIYNAWQGFTLLAIFLGSLPVSWIFGFIPGFSFIFTLFYILLFSISAYSAFMTWSGRYVNIPIVSKIAMQLSGK